MPIHPRNGPHPVYDQWSGPYCCQTGLPTFKILSSRWTSWGTVGPNYLGSQIFLESVAWAQSLCRNVLLRSEIPGKQKQGRRGDCGLPKYILKQCMCLIFLQGDATSPPYRKSVLNVHWKDWCWSWSSDTLASWCERADSLKKTLMLGKIEGKIEKEAAEDETVGWHHWLSGHAFRQTLGDGDGQGSLGCYSHGVTKSWIQLGNWTTMVHMLSSKSEVSDEAGAKVLSMCARGGGRGSAWAPRVGHCRSIYGRQSQGQTGPGGDDQMMPSESGRGKGQCLTTGAYRTFISGPSRKRPTRLFFFFKKNDHRFL